MGSSESVSLEPSSEKPADPSFSDALPYASMWTVALAEESYGLIRLAHCLEIQPRWPLPTGLLALNFYEVSGYLEEVAPLSRSCHAGTGKPSPTRSRLRRRSSS